MLGGLALTFALVTWIVMSASEDRNELGLVGELEITTTSDTVVYVGDRKLGGGAVVQTWNDLLGVSGQRGGAVPGRELEQLGGEDAEVVWRKEGPTGVHRGEHDVNYRFDELLFKRPEGSYDHVLALTCEFPQAEGSRWQWLMIPIRVRSTDRQLVDFYPQAENERAGSFSRGMIPSRHDNANIVFKLDVRRGTWPEEVDRPTVPLWSPREQ